MKVKTFLLHAAILSMIAVFLSTGCGTRLANGKKCPPGTRLIGAAPPKGTEQWCQKKEGWPIKEGFYLEWDPNGQKINEGEYKNGNREGHWTSWYKNGRKRAEYEYIDGGMETYFWYWYENGQQELDGKYRYKNGLGLRKEGPWTEWFENGQKWAEGEFRNGELEGHFTSWYENGQKQTEGECKKGIREGLWTFWYENGQKIQVDELYCVWPSRI